MSNCSYLNSNSSNFDKSNRSFTFYVISLSASILVAVLAPVAVVGNGLILAAIWRNPSLRTPSYILLAGLAFTDFGTGLITQPIYVANEFMELHIITPDENLTLMIIMNLASVCATFFSNMTVIIMTVLAIERWLHMARSSFITVRRACFVVVFILILPIPLVAFRTLHNIKKTYQLEADLSSITVLVLCLIGTSVAYFKVFLIIRRHQQRIQANALPQNVAQPRINFEKYKKLVFTILYIVAVFYVGYLPVVATLWLRLISNNRELQDLVLNVSFVFVILCSSLNPFLYVWRMKDIRNEVTLLIKRMFCKN